MNATDGTERWTRPAFLPTADLDLTAADADRDHLYLPTADRLFAMTRETGREAWAAPLPLLPDGNSWVVRAGKRAVIAHATAAVAEESPPDVARRVGRRFTEFPSSAAAVRRPDGAGGRGVPYLPGVASTRRPAGRSSGSTCPPYGPTSAGGVGRERRRGAECGPSRCG